MKSLQEMAAETLMRDASTQAIEFEGHWLNWGEMRHVTGALATLIAASGISAKAPVVLIARSRPSAIAALFLLIAQGRTIRMIYPFQSATGIARDIIRLKPALVIAAADDFSPEVRDVLIDQGIAGIATAEMDAHAVPGLEYARPGAAPDVMREPQIEILTSGTTGPPKQFPITYTMIAKFLVGAHPHSGATMDMSIEPPAILYFPLGNISGIYYTLPTLIKGQRAVLLDRFSIEKWHDYVLRYRPRASGIPPAAMQALLDADIPAEDFASIKTMGSGAAPLDPTVQRAFEERYGIPILCSYGATEFAGPVCMMTAELHAEFGRTKFGTVGRAFGGAKLRVIDAETGAEVPPGSAGLLEVVSPRIGPHWIRTSDIAVIDEDGFMFLRGRADGAIMRGGFKVLPETIERALMLHPDISAAAVVGVADARVSQVPGAAIEVTPGHATPDSAALEAHLREHVLATHIPVHWRFVDTLPKNASHKIDRTALKRLFESTA